MNLSSTQSIRVLLIDDHTLFRAGLRMIIEGRGFVVVGEAGNRDDALAAASLSPDVILLDLDLGEVSGLDLLPELLAIAPSARVLVLTGMRDPEIHRQAVRLGAMGLVLKDKAVDTVVKAIERVFAGEVWLERTLIARVISDLSRPAEAAIVAPEATKINSLSAREREVLALICAGLRNGQVAERLTISEATVRHHLSSIFGKLGVADRVELVIFAYQHGLVTAVH